MPPSRQQHAQPLEESRETTLADSIAVETRDLSKRFGDRTVVDGVSLSVPRGSAFGYLGPNGAGKTTLIRMLLGLTSASSGSMRMLGLPVPKMRAAALARTGAIVEEPRFHPHLTGRENLSVVAAARDLPACRRIDESLLRVGLAERADERVKTYSLGMRQRLGIARCLLADPQLLILDEPMNGLDPAGIREFRAFVRAFVEDGRTIVLSSHLLDEIEKTCDHVAIVDRGRIVVQGTVDELRGQDGAELTVRVDDTPRARALLGAHRAVAAVAPGATDDELRVSLLEAESVAELNRALVEAGIAVRQLAPSRATLEQRFLEATSRLEPAA